MLPCYRSVLRSSGPGTVKPWLALMKILPSRGARGRRVVETLFNFKFNQIKKCITLNGGNAFRGGGRSSWLGIQGAPLLVPFESVPLCMNSSSIDPFRLISSFPSCYSYSYSCSWVRPGRVRYVLHPVTRQCGGPQWEAGQYSAPSVRQHHPLAPAATARAGSARQRQAASGSVRSSACVSWRGVVRVVCV